MGRLPVPIWAPMAAGNAEAHGCVVALRAVETASEPKLDATEEHVTGFGEDEVAGVFRQEAVHFDQQLGNAERGFARGALLRRALQVVVVGHLLPEPRELPLGQGTDEIAQGDVAVLVVGDVHPAVRGPDRAVARDLGLGGAQIDVGQLGPEGEDQVRFSHPLLDRGGAEGSHVDAHVKRVIHREDALGEDRGDDGHTQLLRQRAGSSPPRARGTARRPRSGSGAVPPRSRSTVSFTASVSLRRSEPGLGKEPSQSRISGGT